MSNTAKLSLVLTGILLLFLKFSYDLYRGATDGLSPNIGNDAINMLWPFYEYAQTSIQSGTLPLWNPYSSIGEPFFANIITGLLYPINWLVFVLEVPLALLAIQFATVLIGMAGMYFYSRYLGLAWPARALSSLLFAYAVFTEAFHPALGSTFCWFPALLYLTHRFFDRPSFRNAFLISIVLALCFLAGFPNFFYYTCLTIGVYFLVVLMLSRTQYGVGGIARRMGVLALGLVLMLGLVAVQLLPTYELMALSVRNVGSGSAYQSDSFWEIFSLGALFKNYLLADSVYIYANSILRIDAGLYYLGGALLLLMPFSYLLKKYRNISIALTVSFVFLVLFMLSNQVPALSFLQRIPGAESLRVNGRAVAYTQFLSIVLAGIGLSAICDCIKHGIEIPVELPAWAGRVLYLAYAALLAYLAFSIPGNNGIFFGFVPCVVLIAIALVPDKGALAALRSSHLAWMIALVIALDVSAHRNNRFLVPAFFTSESSYILTTIKRIKENSVNDRVLFAPSDLAQSVEFTNVGPKYGIASISSYNSLTLARWQNYVRHMVGAQKFDAIISQSVLRRFYGDFSMPLVELVLKRPWLLDSFSLRYIASEAGITENHNALPRAYAVSQYIQTQDEEGSLSAVKDNLPLLRQTVILENAAPSFQSVKSTQGRAEVVIKQLEADRVELSVDLAQPSIVVLTDAYYPGWTAEVDGERTAIFRANSIFRAVEVPQGKHSILFRYGLSNGYWAAGISLSSVIVMILIAVREWSLERSSKVA